MPKGGKRQGSGAKLGQPQKRTLEKQEQQRQFRERIAEHIGPIADALVQSALGVSHMMAREKDGKWTQVTDPKIMARVLESGQSFYRIHAQNPDVRAIKESLDRLFGQATQHVEVEPVVSPDNMTDAELLARAAALSKALKS